MEKKHLKTIQKYLLQIIDGVTHDNETPAALPLGLGQECSLSPSTVSACSKQFNEKKTRYTVHDYWKGEGTFLVFIMFVDLENPGESTYWQNRNSHRHREQTRLPRWGEWDKLGNWD